MGSGRTPLIGAAAAIALALGTTSAMALTSAAPAGSGQHATGTLPVATTGTTAPGNSAATVAAPATPVATATSPSAVHATSSYPVTTTDPPTSYTTVDDVWFTMSDGVKLDSDEYIPTTCTTAKPCPVILIQTPYRKSSSSASPETIPYLYEHGYIEVVVDVRGTGSSQGCWSSFGPREQQDGAQLVEDMATLKNSAGQQVSDGKVGLAGVSYSGINQLLTAEQPGMQGPHSPLKAIFPIVPMSDAYRDVAWAGGNIDAGFIPLWLGLVNGLALEPADYAQSQPTIALSTESQHLCNLTDFTAPVVADAQLGAYESLLPADAQTFPEQAYDSSFYTERSPVGNSIPGLTPINKLTTPTFIVGGTYDLFQRAEPLLYNALNLPPTEKKLLIGPWYHVTEGSGLTADDGSGAVHDAAGNEIPSTDNLELAWFDYFLKGIHNGVETFPTVEAYQLGSDRWVPQIRYPAAGTTGQRWYLSGSPTVGGGSVSKGTMTTSGPGSDSTGYLPAIGANGACSRSTWQWTAGLPAEAGDPSTYTGSPTPCEDDSSATEVQGLTFTSPAFTSPYTINGPIEADVFMSSTSADSTVIATLSDVDPSADHGAGIATDITSGTLVASLRPVSPTHCPTSPTLVVFDCSVFLDGQSIEPWHPYTQNSQYPLLSGQIYELQIEIFPTSETFEPGHQMRVTLTTSDVPHEGTTLSTAANSLGIDTFYLGADHPSSIYLGAVG